jgi:hypothetical protein
MAKVAVTSSRQGPANSYARWERATSSTGKLYQQSMPKIAGAEAAVEQKQTETLPRSLKSRAMLLPNLCQKCLPNNF